MEAFHEFSKIEPMLVKEKKVVMVGKDHPGRQFRVEFCDQYFEDPNP